MSICDRVMRGQKRYFQAIRVDLSVSGSNLVSYAHFNPALKTSAQKRLLKIIYVIDAIRIDFSSWLVHPFLGY